MVYGRRCVLWLGCMDEGYVHLDSLNMISARMRHFLQYSNTFGQVSLLLMNLTCLELLFKNVSEVHRQLTAPR